MHVHRSLVLSAISAATPRDSSPPLSFGGRRAFTLRPERACRSRLDVLPVIVKREAGTFRQSANINEFQRQSQKRVTVEAEKAGRIRTRTAQRRCPAARTRMHRTWRAAHRGCPRTRP